jgi:hypothetical protein
MTGHAGGLNGSGTVVSMFVPPPLNISYSGGNAVLAWPTNADGFGLVSATNLGSTASWMPVSPQPANNNGQFMVTNSSGGGPIFFRLSR